MAEKTNHFGSFLFFFYFSSIFYRDYIAISGKKCPWLAGSVACPVVIHYGKRGWNTWPGAQLCTEKVISRKGVMVP